MTWVDQGRQERGWFGHGTAPEESVSPAELRARAGAVVEFAAERAGGQDQKAAFDAEKTKDTLRALAPVIAPSAGLSPQVFRAKSFGSSFDPVDAWAIQRVMRNIADAHDHAGLVAAGHELAETANQYGREDWSTLMSQARLAASQASAATKLAAAVPPQAVKANPTTAPTEPTYSSQRPGYHGYTQGPTLICSANLHCSKEGIADAMVRHAVPGQDPSQPVESGLDYPVIFRERLWKLEP